MEAVVYDESPLADYLEGDAFHHEVVQTISTPPSPRRYAPSGLPRLQSHFHKLRQRAAKVTSSASERCLERLRYIVIASQLLSDDTKLRPPFEEEYDPLSTAFTVTGALISAVVPFSISWSLHRLKLKWQADTWSKEEALTYSIPLFLFALFALSLVYAQYLRFVRRSSTTGLSKLVGEFQEFDASCGAALRFIQEVEVVARGYRISQSLPPATFLEDRHDIKHCSELRSSLASSLVTSFRAIVDSHDFFQPFLNLSDLDSYHNIYEVSLKEFIEGMVIVNQLATVAQPTLKDLRVLFAVHTIARKGFFCDILALETGQLTLDIRPWRVLSGNIHGLNTAVEQLNITLSKAVLGAEGPDFEPRSTTDIDNQDETVQTPARRHVKVQTRRFDQIADGVRSLATKTRLLRDEINALTSSDASESAVAATLLKHYDNVGSELRSLLHEWENGRHSMYLNLDTDRRHSRRSSGFFSPMSPSPSLGGTTLVEAAHADTMKALTGDIDPLKLSDSGSQDEEVFEAIAMPRKRLSVTMTREDKMAKIQEDRRKRATLQEQAQNTTSMLRELQMVIKHRPHARRPSQAVSA